VIAPHTFDGSTPDGGSDPDFACWTCGQGLDHPAHAAVEAPAPDGCPACGYCGNRPEDCCAICRPALSDRDVACDLVYRAFQLVIAMEEPEVTFSDEQLEELFYCLTMACVKIKKLPGGTAAAARVYARAEAELAKRYLRPTCSCGIVFLAREEAIAHAKATKHRVKGLLKAETSDASGFVIKRQEPSTLGQWCTGRNTWAPDAEHAIHFLRWKDADSYRVRELGNQPHTIVARTTGADAP
jgi:hypothetical protein